MGYQIINGEYVKMRRESEMPQNPTEQSIENALVELGVDREELEFTSVFRSSKRYIRYRYWRHLPITFNELVELGLEEDADYDDDCGYRYMYFI